jgi:hypothetical protein
MKYLSLKNLFLIIALAISLPLKAQEAEATSVSGKGAYFNDIMTVSACAIGGAVLGLSTLSFTEEPGDHLKNIVVGGAVGLIIGVAAVAYMQANKTNTYYSHRSLEDLQKNFGTKERSNLLADIHESKQEIKNLPQVFYSFNF